MIPGIIFDWSGTLVDDLYDRGSKRRICARAGEPTMKSGENSGPNYLPALHEFLHDHHVLHVCRFEVSGPGFRTPASGRPGTLVCELRARGNSCSILPGAALKTFLLSVNRPRGTTSPSRRALVSRFDKYLDKPCISVWDGAKGCDNPGRKFASAR